MAGFSKKYRDLIREMSTEEISATIAAYLVQYRTSKIEKYDRIKKALENHFTENFITGLTFVEVDNETKAIALEVVNNASSCIFETDKLMPVGVHVNAF